MAYVKPTKDTSEVPQWMRELREKRKERTDSDTGLSTKRTESAAEKGLPPWKVELDQKEMRQTPVKDRDHYVRSWLKSTDSREKFPSAPNLVYVTPTKDTLEVPQWMRELREKQKERTDSDTGLSTKRTESAAEKGLPPWKVELDQKEMRQTPVKDRDHYVPSWLKSTDLREKSPSTPNLVYVTPTKDTSEVPQWKSELREKRKERKDSDTGLSTIRTESAAEKGLPPWKVELDQKEMRQTPVKDRDHYVRSWLKSTDSREKFPSTPNLVYVTPTKDTSKVPQWKREVREKRKERKDSDTGLSTKRTESAAEKGLPPWKVELGQKEMRQTPVKDRDHYVPSWLRSTDLREKSPSTPNLVYVTPTKDTSKVPQWMRKLREKRKERKDSDTGLSTKRTESAAEKGLPPWKVELDQKGMRQTPVKDRDHYVPSWLRSTDLREKSPSTPNLVYVTPTKDTSKVPQWMRKLREKRKERKDSDTGLSTKRTEFAVEKGLHLWKVELGWKKMRQTPVKDGTADSIKTVDGVGIAHGIETVDDIKTAGSVEIVDGDGTADDIGTIDGIGTEDGNGTVEDGTADSIKTVDGVGIAHGIETVDDIKTAGSVEIVDGDGTADDIGTIDGIGTEVGNGTVEGNLSSPENEPTLSQVEINFLRIVNLLTTICPSAVRVYFDQQIPPNELKTFFDLEKNNKILENLQKRRIITQVQWKLLFPSDGRDPSSSTFDVTLMVAILRNLKGMTVYDGPPSTYKNVTDSMAVSRIKYYRNHIVHSSTGQLSDNEFNIIFDEIVEAIEKLSPSMKSKCDLLRIRELDRSFIEVCQEFINKEKQYEVIRKEQTAIQADNKLLQKEHTTLQADHLALKKKQEHVASQLMFIESKQDIYQDEIKRWEEKNKTFVKTKNIDSIIKVLQRENCVTVFGKSGMGKSATIHHIALHYQNTYGYTITPCKSPVHIKKVSDKRQIFVIDDMCGTYKIRQNVIEDWLKLDHDMLDLLDFDDKLIVSCRSEIFRHPKFQMLKLFVKHTFELSYCKEDHLEIAAKYLTSENIEEIKDVIDISLITPLLFVLYSRNPNSNLSEFIDSPFKIYTQEWNRLAQLNAPQFCVLFLCMLYNGCIDLSSFLSEFQNTESRLKLESIFDQCGIERGTSSQTIIAQLCCLEGSYVELKNERYVLMHDALLDFLCCYFGERFPEIVIKYADKKIIFERIQLKSISACHEKYIIEIPEEFEREYFQRISKEILNGNIMEALDSPQMQYEQYQVKMVHILQQLDKQKLKDLMMKPTDGLTISEPLFLACSRGYDPIVRLFIDAGADINQRNSCGHTPLVAASFNGQKKTVLLLIKKDASVNLCDFDGWTALKYACGKGFIDIVQLLLSNRASIVDVYSNYRSPLDTAKLYGHKEIMDLLLSNGADKITFPTRAKSDPQYQRKSTETVMSAKWKQIRPCKNHYDSQMRHMAKKKKSKYHELV